MVSFLSPVNADNIVKTDNKVQTDSYVLKEPSSIERGVGGGGLNTSAEISTWVSLRSPRWLP